MPSSLNYGLHVHLDPPAAGQSDLPGHLIGYAVFQHTRLSGFYYFLRLADDGSFHTAPGNGADKVGLRIHHQLTTAGTRRRTPGFNYGSQGDLAAFFKPVLRCIKNVLLRHTVYCHDIWGQSKNTQQLTNTTYR